MVSTDGLILGDTNTGLVWQREGSGARNGTGCDGTHCNWQGVKDYCAGLTLDGAGWRLPTLTELTSIVDTTVAFPPTIDQTAFPNTSVDGVWSSSPYAGSSGFAWGVNFLDGASGDFGVGSLGRVRCVR